MLKDYIPKDSEGSGTNFTLFTKLLLGHPEKKEKRKLSRNIQNSGILDNSTFLPRVTDGF